jgi:hypothetical protein
MAGMHQEQERRSVFLHGIPNPNRISTMGRVYRDGRILSVADSCLLLKMANRIKTSVCRAVGL